MVQRDALYDKRTVPKISEELLMADVCGLDIDEIVQAKIKVNNEKYPVSKAKGRSDKYDKL